MGRVELRYQVAVAAVDVDAVETCLRGPPGRVAEGPHQRLDTGLGQPLGLLRVHGVRHRRGSHRGDGRHHGLADAMAELGEYHPAGLVYGARGSAEGGDHAVVVDPGLVAAGLPAWVDVHVAGEDEARSTGGEATVQVHVGAQHLSAGRGHGLGCGGAHDPVGGGHRPDPPGPEIEGRVAHRDLLMRSAEVGWGILARAPATGMPTTATWRIGANHNSVIRCHGARLTWTGWSR